MIGRNRCVRYPAVQACQIQAVHLAVRLRADAVGNLRPQPATCCAALDRSGPMAGQPLPHAKAVAALAVKNLRPRDFFALLVFDDAAHTVIPLRTAANKPSSLARIDRIAEGGSTILSDGWMLGCDELRKSPARTSRRLLLPSDGQLNVGTIVSPAYGSPDGRRRLHADLFASFTSRSWQNGAVQKRRASIRR
jgi:Ca-activated chloride channel family protein